MGIREKLFAFALACALVSGLAACAAPAQSQGSGASEGGSSSTASSSSAESAGDSSSALATFAIGTTAGNVYRNSSFGISWTAPEGWSFANESELVELNQSVGTEMENEAVASAVQGGSSFLDMLATSADQLANVSLTIEGASAQQMNSATDQQILDSVVSASRASLEGQGAKDVKLNMGTVSLCGAESPCATLSYQLLGYPVFQKAAIMTRGNYVITVTATCVNDDQTTPLLERFQAA